MKSGSGIACRSLTACKMTSAVSGFLYTELGMLLMLAVVVSTKTSLMCTRGVRRYRYWLNAVSYLMNLRIRVYYSSVMMTTFASRSLALRLCVADLNRYRNLQYGKDGEVSRMIRQDEGVGGWTCGDRDVPRCAMFYTILYRIRRFRVSPDSIH